MPTCTKNNKKRNYKMKKRLLTHDSQLSSNWRKYELMLPVRKVSYNKLAQEVTLLLLSGVLPNPRLQENWTSLTAKGIRSRKLSANTKLWKTQWWLLTRPSCHSRRGTSLRGRKQNLQTWWRPIKGNMTQPCSMSKCCQSERKNWRKTCYRDSRISILVK